MKRIRCILFIWVLLGLNFNSEAQITDNNTLLIEKYFVSTSERSLYEQSNQYRFDEMTSEMILSIIQKGDNNYVKLYAPHKSQRVVQVGQNNSFEFLNYYSGIKDSFHVYQLGDANQLQIFGENSIWNRFSIIQSSNLKSIQIYNY